MKSKKEHIRIGFGSSLLLLVFVVISFVSFAVLSLSSAITDQKLSNKIYQKNIDYYNANNLAQEQLATIDAKLAKAYEMVNTPEEFYELVSPESKFSIPVSEYQELQLTVEHNYPVNAGEKFYKITQFQLVSIKTTELNTDLPVFQ